MFSELCNPNLLSDLCNLNITYEKEAKHVLKKLAFGIKTIYAVKQFLPENTCLLILNTLVFSHFQYPAILLQSISQNLLTTLEKQLRWGVKACFDRQKQELGTIYRKTICRNPICRR